MFCLKRLLDGLMPFFGKKLLTSEQVIHKLISINLKPNEVDEGLRGNRYNLCVHLGSQLFRLPKKTGHMIVGWVPRLAAKSGLSCLSRIEFKNEI